MGAKEEAIMTWVLVSAALSPVVWVQDKLDNLVGGPVGFLTREERKDMMAHPRIKQINGPRGILAGDEIEVVTKHRYPGNRERVIMRVRRNENGTYNIHQPIFNTPGAAVLEKRKMKGYSAHIPKDLEKRLVEGTGCVTNGGHIELNGIGVASIDDLLGSIFKVVDLSLKVVEAA
jgi:hypothetical protein